MAQPKKQSEVQKAWAAMDALGSRSVSSGYKAQFTKGLISKLDGDLKHTMPTVKAGDFSVPKGVNDGGKGFNFWHWLGDIVDRPRRAVGNTAQAVLHEGEAAGKIIGGTLSGKPKVRDEGLNEILPAVGEHLSAIPRGLFSTNKDDQRTSSEIIERETDRAGKLLNSVSGRKDYRDTKDNVNPVLKGVLGFVGDVASDPLTYVGIGALGAGVKGGVAAIKAGEGAGAAGRSIGKGLAQYTGADLAISGAKKLKAISTGGRAGEKSLEGGKAFVVGADGEVRRGVVAGEPAVAPVAPVAPPKAAPAVKPEGGTKANPFEAEARPLAPESVGDQMRGHGSFGQVSKHVSALVKRMEREARDQTGNVGPAVQLFQRAVVQDGESAVARAFGPALKDAMKAYSNPKTFDADVKQLHAILSDSGHLDTLRTEDEIAGAGTLAGAMFKDFGIDAAATNVARRRATAGAAESPEAILGRLADESEIPATATAAGRAETATLLSGERNVFDALREVFPSQITESGLEGGRTTAQGARTNAAARGSEESLARFTDRIGTHPQWNLYQALNKRSAAALQRLPVGQRLAGARRSRSLRESYMRDVTVAEHILDEGGAPLHFENGVDEPVALSLGQALHVIGGQDADMQRVIDMALFNGKTAIAPTKLMEAITAQHAGKTQEEVLGILTSAAKREVGKKEAIPHFLAGGERSGIVDFQRGKPPVDAPEGMSFQVSKDGKGFYTLVSNKYLASRLLEGIQRSDNALRTVARDNATSYLKRFQQETLEMSDAVKSTLLAKIMDDGDLAGAIISMTRPQVAKSFGRAARETGARADSTAAAEAVTRAQIPDGVEANVRAAKATAEAGARGDAAGAQSARAAAADDAADLSEQTARVVEDADPDIRAQVEAEGSFDMTSKLTSKAYREVKASMMGKLDPLARRFNASWAMEDRLPLYELQHEPLAVQMDYWGQIKPAIDTLNRKFNVPMPGTTHSVLLEALQQTARGTQSSDKLVAEAQMGMDAAISRVLGAPGEDAVLGSAFGRLGTPVEWLNAQFAEYAGLKNFVIDTEKAEAAFAAGEHRSVYAAGLSQWRDAVTRGDIDDPVGFLTSINHLALKATTHASVVDNLGKHMLQAGLLSSKPQKGYLTARFEKNSPLGAFWNPAWRVHLDMAPGLQRVNELMTDGSRLHGEFGTFLERTYDPIQRAWKFGMTLPRPGHHFRNLVGDASMTFLAEGTRGYTRASRDAFKVMHARGTYGEMDFIRALESTASNEGHLYSGAGEKLVKTRFGDLDAADVWKSLKDRGALPEYKHVEQLDEAATANRSVLQKASEKITTGNKAGEFFGKASQIRDHWSRTQHYLQIMQNYERDGFVQVGFMQRARPKTMNELMDLAARRVQQYHPDGTRLANFEKSTVRRVVPFYSWMRGAIPAVIESGLRHPGRVTAINKASYNAAVAAGIEPESLYDPFPTDQLFPSFLSQNVQGPQLQINGHYWSISPGFATWDLASTFADPKAGLLGSVSPVIRTPIEALSGTQLATGAKIKDPSDYLDSQLPLVGNTANITGFSPTGTVAGLLSGNGADQQRQVREGNKTSDNLVASLLSTVLGVQATDMSRPNFIRYAQFEKKPVKKTEGQATSF